MGPIMLPKGVLSRRTWVKNVVLASAAVALPGLRTSAADAEKLDVKDPAAVAVGYVENAAQVDAQKFPSYGKGSNCENCAQLQGTAGAAYRPCTVFKGQLVAAGGWCSAWAPEM